MSFDFSDAWFLTALILIGKESTLKQIVQTGDAINHAIMTQAEIDRALLKLIPAGYIVATSKNTFIATEKSAEISECSAFKRAGLFSMVDVVLKRLNSVK